MSTEREPADGDLDSDGLDATTRNMIIDKAERLTGVDGPLVGDGDREKVEDLVGEMFEAIGGSRLTYAEADAADLVMEADGDDTHWRKHTSEISAHTDCGPFQVRGRSRDDEVQIEESWVEVMPHSQERGFVTVDSHIKGQYSECKWSQGALHELTPEQARSFAAALLEQAEYVENQQTEP